MAPSRASMLLLLAPYYVASYTHTPTHAALPLQHIRRRAPAVVAQKGGKGKGKKKEDESPYRASVALPITEFSQRAMATKREPELQKFWEENKIYEKLADSNPGELFVLHDGPPYANGDLHIGHALNKILKDMINKYQILQGRKVRYVPGWDCHGLPIELKVLQSMDAKERDGLTPLALRKKAAAFAQETVGKQRESFKRYGVWGDFENPYMTLQPKYEAAQVKVFGEMFLKGHIYRGRKPVNWSPSSMTALAEAELEYNEKHISKSIYVGFKVTQPTEALTPFTVDGSELRVVIWTTTPWTMPANLAIAVNGELEYSVVTHPSLGGKKYMVAKELVGALAKRMDDVLPEGAELEIVATFKGSEVTGTVYEHPFAGRESKVVLGGDYITTDSGTGLVHTAPGHGQDDYLTGLKYGLELLSPVNDAGEFTSEAGDDLEGLSVLGEGNTRCIEKLRASGALVREENYEHKYPYDWRTKEPTIFRATSQWFASVDGFREDALTAIDNVKWQPEIGRNRITAMTQSRSDWCISRQRTWGVPIPVFYHRDTQEVLLDEDTLEHAYKLIGEHGTDIWWSASEKELLPAKYADVADQYQKGTDTMDVWFDSGSSWASVVLEREELSERYPADLYLEGSDQHRGWFQSSLLTSVAVNGHAPYKTVLTHGFVLDEKGYKMSKSLGNVVDPNLVIEGGADLKKQPGYGADTLRLWVSSVNYASDVCIGDGIVKQTSDSYRKLRNTARYVIGSLHDFDPAKHAVPYEQLPALDQYMLGELDAFVAESKASYDDYAFSRVYSLLQQFAVSDLSNFYLDVAKDRLYISHADDTRRRTCQTVMYQVLHAMSAVLAPILPHMAEDIWQALPYTTAHTSVFEAGWPAAATPDSAASSVAEGKAEWGALRVLRDAVNKAIEQARNEKSIGASLEAKVVVHSTDPQLSAALAKYASETNEVDDLRYVLLVSGVEVVGSADEATSKGTLAALTEPLPDLSEDSTVTIGIAKADGAKCERCWNYYTELSDTKADYPSVCERCTVALTKMSYPKVGHLSPKPAAAAQPAPAAKPAPPAPAAATGASPDRLKKVDELINRVRASDGTVIDGFIASSTVLLDSLGSLRSTPVASSSAATAPQAAAKDSTLDEAEAVYRRALANKQKLLGDNHPDTVTATKNLATSLQMQGKVAEAQTLLAGMPDAVVSQVAATPPPAPPPAPTPAPAPAPAPAAATPTVAAETGEPSGASTILTYDATLRKAGIAPKDAILLTPAALASKAGLSLLAAPATAAAPAEAAAPQADNLEDAVAAQGALVRKLKEDDGLTNADPAVQAAVAELKRLKGLAEPAVA